MHFCAAAIVGLLVYQVYFTTLQENFISVSPPPLPPICSYPVVLYNLIYNTVHAVRPTLLNPDNEGGSRQSDNIVANVFFLALSCVE